MIAAIVLDGPIDFFLFLIAVSLGTAIGRLIAEGLLAWVRR